MSSVTLVQCSSSGTNPRERACSPVTAGYFSSFISRGSCIALRAARFREASRVCTRASELEPFSVNIAGLFCIFFLLLLLVLPRATILESVGKVSREASGSRFILPASSARDYTLVSRARMESLLGASERQGFFKGFFL